MKFWPGYLMKCVQDHWNHHWEDYYEEAKSTRNIAESALLTLGKLPPPTDLAVQTLAKAHSVLTQNIKKKRHCKPQEKTSFGF